MRGEGEDGQFVSSRTQRENDPNSRLYRGGDGFGQRHTRYSAYNNRLPPNRPPGGGLSGLFDRIKNAISSMFNGGGGNNPPAETMPTVALTPTPEPAYRPLDTDTMQAANNAVSPMSGSGVTGGQSNNVGSGVNAPVTGNNQTVAL